MKKYIAEFFGTFVLALAVMSAPVIDGGIPTALLAGITLGLFVLTIGKISGAHLNPAVTLGAWSVKKIETREVFPHLLSQFAGAALVIILGRYAGLISTVEGSWSAEAFIGEIIGALVFAFGIASVLFTPDADQSAKILTHKMWAPFVIGGSLALGATLAAGLGANGILNPAVAFGISSFGVAYILGPIIGSVAGMWLYKYLNANA